MFKGQSQEEIKRLLHMVVVGGGPTGVEFAGELQDFFNQDLKKWIPDIHENFHVTLVEALPNVRSNLSFDSPPFFFLLIPRIHIIAHIPIAPGIVSIGDEYGRA